MQLQKSLRLGAVGVALIALVWASLSRGLFDGITLAIAIAALSLSLLQRLPSRPKLIVSPREGDSLVARYEKTVRPFDEDEIALEQVERCHKEMPRMPPPEFPPGSPLIRPLTGFQASNMLLEVTSGVSDDYLRKHLSKVSDYSTDLREWLDLVQAARADRVRLFEGRLRIQEAGQAPADHVRLRLLFPAGFDVDEELPEVPQPPNRPTIEDRFPRMAGLGSLNREVYLQPSARIRLPGSDKPNYSTEDGRVVVAWDLGRLNQSERRDVPAFQLRAAEPGTYQVNWQVTAEGLSKPAEGTIKIQVEAPLSGEPIATLEEIEAERKAYEVAITG